MEVRVDLCWLECTLVYLITTFILKNSYIIIYTIFFLHLNVIMAVLQVNTFQRHGLIGWHQWDFLLTLTLQFIKYPIAQREFPSYIIVLVPWCTVKKEKHGACIWGYSPWLQKLPIGKENNTEFKMLKDNFYGLEYGLHVVIIGNCL